MAFMRLEVNKCINVCVFHVCLASFYPLSVTSFTPLSSAYTRAVDFQIFTFTQFCLFSSVQFSSVSQSCLTLCDPMNCCMPGHPVHHQLPQFTQTHIHRVGDVFHGSHPLSSPSPPAPNPSQHHSLFQWVNSSHEVAKVLEFQPQHQSFQRTPRTDLH